MSGVPARLGLFAALLVVVALGAALLGGAVGPQPATAGDTEKAAGHGEAPAAHGQAHEGEKPTVAGATLPGLAVAAAGVRLELEQPMAARSASAPIRLRLVDDAGRPVRDLEVAHEKRLHLIVVRRDMTGFQHLHPEEEPDGTWAAQADLSAGGTYRVLADFTRGGEQQTLGADLQVPGGFRPAALPAPAATTRDDRGVTVRLRRDGDRVAFDVLRDGASINDELEPYLGAKGHLVTLRAGDLAYLHTHPDGDRLAFETELPTSGTYRLWVQFQLDGQVHTAAFTEEVTR